MTSINPSQTSSQTLPNLCSFVPDSGYSIRRKPRPNDRLGNLPEADQEQILSCVQEVGLRPAVKEIAKPRPEGLGLKIHYNSLRNFYWKHTRPNFELNPEQLAAIPDISKDPVFAQICHKLEEEILVGLDCSENRDETIKLLGIYLRYRSLLQKSLESRSRGRNRFRPQPQLFPEPVAEPSAPSQPETSNPSSSPEQHSYFSDQHFTEQRETPSTSSECAVSAPVQRRANHPSSSPDAPELAEQDSCPIDQHFAGQAKPGLTGLPTNSFMPPGIIPFPKGSDYQAGLIHAANSALGVSSR